MTAAAKPTSLSYYPRHTREWDAKTRTLSFEQMGALDFVSDRAWEDSAAPCTLEDNPGAWQRLLGAKWKALLVVIRRYFTPCAEHPGRVRDEALYALWQRQKGLYDVAADKALKSHQHPGKKRGPKPKRRSPADSSGDSSANSQANSPADSPAIAYRKGGSTPGPSDLGGTHPPASVDAPLTPGGVAPPSATGDDDAPDGAARPDFLALVREAMPGVPRPSDDPAPTLSGDRAAAMEQRRAALRAQCGRENGTVATLDAAGEGEP